MLAECEAVVSVDTDSLKLKKLQEERLALSRKLEIGSGYIAEADLAIENYAMHVKDFTASSLKPLLSPAAEPRSSIVALPCQSQKHWGKFFP
ncbi:hypothetical protein D3C84_1003330 [compost metagenome]